MNFDSSVLQVAIEDIIPNRFQPRLAFEDDSLNELASSIKEHGIIQPLVLRRIGDKFEIIAGERRYKAATMAGLSTVPAVISQIDDNKSAEVAVVENVQRKDLTAIEEAKSYKALLDQGYMSQEQLAKKMGLSQSAISNKLRLLNLAPAVQDAILENKISERHARALLMVKEHESQIKWLNRIISERLTVRQLDNELKKEYGGNNMIDIDTIKQNATDITMNLPQNNSNPIETTFASAPINLGEQTTNNKFFNTLENESVNMQTFENNNPFLNEQPVINNEIVNPAPVINNEIETLDSLDFEPTPVVKETKDLSVPKNKIIELIDELKKEYNINVDINELSNQISMNITIKNED